MRPLRLEFQGIKSYIDKTVVNFDALLKNGLFGVFGDTGSGKSTLLDCIFLALYGKMVRTKNSEGFMNGKCSKAYVDFSFSRIIDGEKKFYRVYREYKAKLDKKNAPTPKAVFYQIVGGNENILAEGADKVNLSVMEIIGLKCDDFEKCIVLPQGEFAAFVAMTKGERLKTVSSLFSLEKYGEKFVKRINSITSNLKTEYAIKTAGLADLEFATKENLKKCKEELNEAIKSFESANIKNSKIKEEFLKFERNYEKHKTYISLTAELDSMNKLLPDFDKKQAYLNKYNFAERVKALQADITEKQELFDKSSKKIVQLKMDISKLEAEVERLKIEKQAAEALEKKIDELKDKRSSLSIYAEQEKKLDNDTRLPNLRIKHKELTEAKNKLIKELDTINLKIEGEFSDDKFLEIKMELNNKLSSIEKTALSSLAKEEIAFLKALYKEANEVAVKLLDGRIKELFSYISTDVSVSAADVRKVLNSFDEFSKKRDAVVTNKHRVAADISSLNEQLEKVYNEGIAVKDEIAKTRENIAKITGSKNCVEVVEQIEKDVAKLNRTIIEARKNYTEANEALLKKQSLPAVEEERCKMFSADIKKEKKEHDKIIAENFRDASEVYTVLTAISDYKLIKAQTDKFFLDLHSKSKNHEKLKVELNGFCATESEYEKQVSLVKELDEKISLLNKNIIEKEIIYKNLSLNFDKRCIIESDAEKIRTKMALYEALSLALKGNALVDFIADEYLKEIAVDARETLLTLTSGKYGMAYEDDNFVVIDNLNGGSVRKMDTVSGGELFLVSLSLALSLSKSICAKSKSPIEFFFLDEGFGSLDRGLVEVVTDSLEKLKNSSFSIGVISHLDALKERMACRINVTGATTVSGSKLTVVTG